MNTTTENQNAAVARGLQRGIVAIRQERDTLAADAKGILERSEGTLSDEDKAEFERLEGELEQLKSREEWHSSMLAKANAGQLGFESGTPFGDGDAQRAATPDPSVPPSLLPSADVLSALHGAVVGRQSLRTETQVLNRATVLTSDSGADQLAVQLTGSPRRERRIVLAAGVTASPVDGVTSAEYPVFGAGPAAITAEGALKAEYDAITPGSATPQMITVWTDTTRQNLLSMTSFEAKLRNVLSSKVAAREDQLLLDTAAATAGILTLVGALSADLVLEGAAMVAASEVGAEPNLVAVNPADVPVLLGPDVGAGGSASPSFAGFLPTIHGMVVYPTNHITAGTATLGAWPAASRLAVGIRPTFLVDAVSGIKNNLVTTLLEEAVALAIDEPQGFLRITAT